MYVEFDCVLPAVPTVTTIKTISHSNPAMSLSHGGKKEICPPRISGDSGECWTEEEHDDR